VAVRVVEGFETGDTDTLWAFNSVALSSDTVGYWSRWSLLCNGGSGPAQGWGQLQIPTAPAELYMAARSKGAPRPTYNDLLDFRSSESVVHLKVQAIDTGFVRVLRGDNTVLATSSVAIQPSVLATWGNIWELYVKIADAGGRLVLKHNGTTYIDFTGDTRNGSLADMATLTMWALETNAVRWDEVIVYDATGTRNNSWVGEKAVVALRPVDQGDVQQLNREPSATSFTRAYFPSDSALAEETVAPDPAAGWHDVSQMVRYPLAAGVGFASAMATRSVTRPASMPNPFDQLIGQWISEPLAAQTISGTVKGQMRARESGSAADARAQVVIKVVSGDGQTVRGTLVDFSGAALSSEFSTTMTNRKFPLAAISPVTMSSVVAQAGDRLVIEIGSRRSGADPGSTEFRLGESGGSDLPEDETTTQDQNPWMEFSSAITVLAENWWAVDDDLPADDDQSYVHETTVNDYDLYHFEDLDGVWGVVDALAIGMRTRAVEPGGAEIAAVLKSGAVENTSGDQAISPVWDWFSFLYDEDPTDSAAWTPSKVNNLQAGPKIR